MDALYNLWQRNILYLPFNTSQLYCAEGETRRKNVTREPGKINCLFLIVSVWQKKRTVLWARLCYIEALIWRVSVYHTCISERREEADLSKGLIIHWSSTAHCDADLGSILPCPPVWLGNSKPQNLPSLSPSPSIPFSKGTQNKTLFDWEVPPSCLAPPLRL